MISGAFTLKDHIVGDLFAPLTSEYFKLFIGKEGVDFPGFFEDGLTRIIFHGGVGAFLRGLGIFFYHLILL
jgi:hypothetical protein